MAKKEVTKKSWYKSKTKWAALLIAVGPVLATVGGMIQGSIDVSAGIIQLTTEIGIVFGVFGIRDLPFVNRTK